MIKNIYAVCIYHNNNITIETNRDAARIKLIRSYLQYQLNSTNLKDSKTTLTDLYCVFQHDFIPNYGEIKNVYLEEDEQEND